MRRNAYLVVLFAQHSYNPSEVVESGFHKSYPNSEPRHWSHTSVGWSVTFNDRDNDNGDAVAHFDIHGRHRDTYIPYDNNDVPSDLREHVRNKYPGDDYEYTRIERHDGEDYYRVRMRHHHSHKTFYVDEQGNYFHHHENY